MSKALKVIGKILLGLVLFVIVLLYALRIVDGVLFGPFYSKSEAAFFAPAINDGFVHQGFDYDEENNTFLVAGYMTDKSASRVYILDEKGNVERYVSLKKANGKPYTGHTGGVEHYGDYMYITGSKGLDVFSYAEVKNGASEVTLLGTVLTYNDPAHCYISNGHILVGSFHDCGAYLSESYEQIDLPDGSGKNNSTAIVFALNESFTDTWSVDPTPKAVVSTGNNVQGMCVTADGRVVLSTSFGATPSKLLVYDTTHLPTVENYNFAGTFNNQTFSFNVKLLYLENSSLIQTITAPAMSEELVYRNGKMYIMCESASNKYLFGKFTNGIFIHAYKIG